MLIGLYGMIYYKCLGFLVIYVNKKINFFIFKMVLNND